MSLRAQPTLKRAQRGAALMLLAVMLVLGGTWLIVSVLNSAKRDSGATRTANGDVLQQAKAGLLGYLAVSAGSAAENYPGRLPCPEAAVPGTEGVADTYCTLPAVGRLPWRTLGIDKLTDAAGEPLWYVLSPGFNRANSGVTLKINSDTAAQLTVDGQANAAVALIIAPGAAINVQAASGCSARAQTRSQTFPLDLRDYLECENATSPADASFVTTGSSTSFNDQVIAVTHADVFNIVDVAVAKRIETDIAPSLRGAYDSADWNSTATTPKFPFAATFGNPDTSNFTGSVGTYQGLLPLTYSTQPGSSNPCVVSGSDSRCDPDLVTWKTGSGLSYSAPLPISNGNRWSVYSTYPSMSVPSSNPYITLTEVWNRHTTRATLARLDCTESTSTEIRCDVTYGRSCNGCSASYTVQPRVRLTVRAQNVSKTFKTFDSGAITSSRFQESTDGSPYGYSPLGVLRSDGDADITTEWLLPSKSCSVSLCNTVSLIVPIELLIDHPVTNSADGTMGWFISNEWHKHTYYAISTGNAPGGSGSCVAGGSPACLTVNESGGVSTSKNAILLLAGRRLDTIVLKQGNSPPEIPAQVRPGTTLADYFEGENANASRAAFDKVAPQSLLSALPSDNSKPKYTVFNDRLMSLYP